VHSTLAALDGRDNIDSFWHLLADPDARYRDLGSDFYQSKINTRRRERDLVRQLEHLTGKKVTLTPQPKHPAA
jgi:transposase